MSESEGPAVEARQRFEKIEREARKLGLGARYAQKENMELLINEVLSLHEMVADLRDQVERLGG